MRRAIIRTWRSALDAVELMNCVHIPAGAHGALLPGLLSITDAGGVSPMWFSPSRRSLYGALQ
jgi:hypothetical protein